MAYVLLLERLERQVLAEQQIAATIKAAGGEVDIPDLLDRLAEFDAMLLADRTVEQDSEKAALRRALGLPA